MSVPPNMQFMLTNVLEKMSNPDSDFRFMSLNDLFGMLTNPMPSMASIDANLLSRITEGVVRLLEDKNGEVQNLAVKCLGPLAIKVKDHQIAPLVDRLASLSMTAEDRSIPSTALRSVIANLPRPQSVAVTQEPQSPTGNKLEAPSPTTLNATVYAIHNTLMPKLLELLNPDQQGSAGGATLDGIDLLVETVKCFGPILSGAEVEQLQVAVMKLLESDRTSNVVKKRAVAAMSLLCVYAPEELLSSFINHLIETFRVQSQHQNLVKLRLFISVTGALAREIPDRFGPYLKTICPFVMSVVDGRDLKGFVGNEPDVDRDEVRETALVSLEAFQSYCTEDMKLYTQDLINAGMNFLKYDPNYATYTDEDEDMEANQSDDEDVFEDDDAFDDDGNFSDDDDMSWKVRRCAAKLLTTVISTRAGNLIRGESEGGGLAYQQVAPLLVERFHEREENVRLEVLTTTTTLVKKTGEVSEGNIIFNLPIVSSTADTAMGPPPKKRRGSDTSMMDATLPEKPIAADNAGVRKSLSAIMPRLSKSLGKLLNNKATTLPTKQASISLLSTIVTVLHGGLEESLGIFVAPLVEAAKGTGFAAGGNVVASAGGGSSAATATGSTVRIEALRLLAKIFDRHTPDAVSSYLEVLVPAVSQAVNERGYKISYEALSTVSSLVRLLTSEGALPQSAYLQTLFDVVYEKVQSPDTDLEVRERAIIALGLILGRTSGDDEWISADGRHKALDALLERMKAETTRISAARAIDGIAQTAVIPGDLDAAWVDAVVSECAAQLRKANRILRAASVDALRSIAENDVSRTMLRPTSKRQLVQVLAPLLVVGDMHLLALSLGIVRCMMIDPQDGVKVDEVLSESICNLVKNQLGHGTVVDSLLKLIATVGELEPDGKQSLMKGLLRNVGIQGETSLVAKVVAQLFVSGGGDNGGFPVKTSDFLTEIRDIGEARKKCLALMILGEIGLRTGKGFNVQPDTFTKQFSAKSDEVPLAAAVALGMAGAGNVEAYVPVILSGLQSEQDSYLFIHSLKEVISHSCISVASSEAVKENASKLWPAILATATSNEDSRAVAAECIGRLTILDPYSFLPELQKYLRDPKPPVRGLVISALRYTFTDTDSSYDELLRPIVVDFLETMLQDTNIENRRLALTALNSAILNKAHLVNPGLPRLLPLVYTESQVRPDLIREIQMGPFRHRVDDGLELRKSAYETLYSLLETAFSSLDIAGVYYERVIAGLHDEQDIRALANLIVTKLVVVAKDETTRRLESICDCLRATLSEKPKDNAVKQEIEKHKEGVRGALKLALLLHREVAVATGSSKWTVFWEWTEKNFSDDVKGLVEGEQAVQIIV